MDKLQRKYAFDEHAGCIFLSRNDVQSYPINKLVLKGPMNNNVFLPLFGGEIYSPVFRREPVNYGPAIGIGISSLIMKKLIIVAVEAPIVRVKLLLQNQGALIKSGRLSTPYNGIMDCFARTIKNEGVFSLWKGNSAALLRIFPDQSINIVSNVVFKKHIYKLRGEKDGNQNWFFGNMLAGVGGAASACLFSYPLEFAHTRLANDIIKSGGERQFKGLFDVYKKILKSDGIAGVYRGARVSCVAIVVHYCLTVPMRRPDYYKQKSPLERGFFDSSTVVIASLATYPFSTISRRMMMTSGEAFKYNSAINAFLHIIQHEGVPSLYRGFVANLLRNVPVFCALAAWRKWVKHTKSGACISVVIETK